METVQNINFLLTTTVVSQATAFQATELLYMVPFVAATLTFSLSFVFIPIQYKCRWEILIYIVQFHNTRKRTMHRTIQSHITLYNT